MIVFNYNQTEQNRKYNPFSFRTLLRKLDYTSYQKVTLVVKNMNKFGILLWIYFFYTNRGVSAKSV